MQLHAVKEQIGDLVIESRVAAVVHGTYHGSAEHIRHRASGHVVGVS